MWQRESRRSEGTRFLRFRFFCFLSHFALCLSLSKCCDCDSCFYNDVPTDIRSIKHERDIFANAIARIHCLVAN